MRLLFVWGGERLEIAVPSNAATVPFSKCRKTHIRTQTSIKVRRSFVTLVQEIPTKRRQQTTSFVLKCVRLEMAKLCEQPLCVVK